ncbi:hypothetical protein ABBQ32_007261 [Trebouxia sp. C0010 RCD-2024]
MHQQSEKQQWLFTLPEKLHTKCAIGSLRQQCRWDTDKQQSQACRGNKQRWCTNGSANASRVAAALHPTPEVHTALSTGVFAPSTVKGLSEMGKPSRLTAAVLQQHPTVDSLCICDLSLACCMHSCRLSA